MSISSISLAILMAAGCAPAVMSLGANVESSEDESSGAGVAGDGDGSGSDRPSDDGEGSGSEADTGDDSDSDSTGGSGDDGDPADSLAFGVWLLDEATELEDTCGWSGLVNYYVGVTTLDFLPESFIVREADSGFQIKAQSFGARDFINCSFTGDDFSCSLQTVDGLEVIQGWPTYWVYEIDFSGTLVDSRTIVGQATVEFPQTNPGDMYALGSSGFNFDTSNCAQVFDMTLVAAD